MSELKKWNVIGKDYTRLTSVLHLLPPRWSVIYKLAALKPDVFDRLCSENVINQTVTIREIDEKLSDKKFVSHQIRIILEFDSSVDPTVLREVNETLQNYKMTSVYSLHYTKETEKIINKAAREQEAENVE